MASLIELFLISTSLALDALSVSIAGGIKSQSAKTKHALKVAAFFGTFQAGMPLIGWSIGALLAGFVSSYAHIITFGLLTIIGMKMTKESLETPESKSKNIYDNKTLTLLAIATSIDALIVGVTFNILQIPLLLSICVIGFVTFILCFFGYLFGGKLGSKLGKRVEIFGGIALIAMGIKILVENL